MSFRVEFIRSGVKYEYKYRNTIASAVKVAKARGFVKTGEERSFMDSHVTPVSAKIYARADQGYHEETWELVATVDEYGVHPVDYDNRTSVGICRSRITKLEAKIREARELHAKLLEIHEKAVA